MENINEIEIEYMGKCTIADYIQYSENPKSCKDLQKIGAIVYLNVAVNKINIPDDVFGADTILEYVSSDINHSIFYVLYVVKKLELKELPFEIYNIIGGHNEDEMFDSLRDLLNKIKF